MTLGNNLNGKLSSKNMNNMVLKFSLNQYGKGWKKVYQNGWIDGKEYSMHHFQDESGKVFDFWIKEGWS